MSAAARNFVSLNMDNFRWANVCSAFFVPRSEQADGTRHILNDEDCTQKIRKGPTAGLIPVSQFCRLDNRRRRSDGFRYSVDGDRLRFAPNADGMLTGLVHDTWPNTLSAVFVRNSARLETSTAKTGSGTNPPDIAGSKNMNVLARLGAIWTCITLH